MASPLLYKELAKFKNQNVLKKFREIKNTPDRVAKALEEHPTWSRDEIEKQEVTVLRLDEIYFYDEHDDDPNQKQPRVEGTNPSVIEEYVLQANRPNGEGGIRKAIEVELYTGDYHDRPFTGKKGHHRYLTAEKCKLEYIFAKITHPLKDPVEELNDQMGDNAHIDNGFKNTIQDIKSAAKRMLEMAEYFFKERMDIAVLQAKIASTETTDEEKKLFKKSIRDKEAIILDDLSSKIRTWGYLGKNVRGLAKQALKKYKTEQIYKIKVPKEDERTSWFECVLAKFATESGTVVSRFHSSNNQKAFTSKFSGDVMAKVVALRKDGKEVRKLVNVVSVHGCAGTVEFNEQRIRVDEFMKQNVKYGFSYRQESEIEVLTLYIPQSLAPKTFEKQEIKFENLLTVEDVKNNLRKLCD